VHLTVPELGALFLVLFGLFHWLGILAATRAVLALLGTVAIGTGGTAGRVLADVSAWLAHAGGAVTAWAFGAAVAGVAFIIALVIFIHDLHPKKGASRRTGWVAILLGISLAGGVAAIPALAPVASGINSLLSGIASFLNSL
jgi:hypothetical protein